VDSTFLRQSQSLELNRVCQNPISDVACNSVILHIVDQVIGLYQNLVFVSRFDGLQLVFAADLRAESQISKEFFPVGKKDRTGL